MRTTLTIDDDVFAAARSLALAQSETIGSVLSDLARRGLNATDRADLSDEEFPYFRVPEGARPITLEDVKKAEDEP